MELGEIILILLLPISALSGWYFASRSYKKTEEQGRSLSQYFAGLNFLLQERPDKAIEVFVKMVEVDSDTVETHLALGSLFRQRGEVDRAIRIHQNIIARPALSKEQSAAAIHELAIDFLKAGLLDRAEHLFQQLVNDKTFGKRALYNLINISQVEKEWSKAIEFSTQLYRKGDKQIAVNLSNYLCEQAEVLEKEGEYRSARSLLQRALEYNPVSVRAEIELASIAFKQNKNKDGFSRLKEALSKDPSYIPVLLNVFEQSGYKEKELILEFAETCLQEAPESSAAILKIAKVYSESNDKERAKESLLTFLEDNPSIIVLRELLNSYEIHLSSVDIADILDRKNLEEEVYYCNKCGYQASSMKWKCPSCQNWDCIKPDWHV